MKVCILADPGNADGTLGGAELTMREFALAIPDSHELVSDVDEAEAVVIGNCVHLAPETDRLRGKLLIRYHNDLARHEDEELRLFLAKHALHVFTSPMHRDLYGDYDAGDSEIVPPPIDLAAFRPSRQVKRNTKREGACAIAAWHNPGKGQRLVREWSETHGEVDVYGAGQFIPTGPKLRNKGKLEPHQVASVLWEYETFIHLPTAPEPFGRSVVEAWAAGCKLVVNEQVGALHFIRHDPKALERAAEDFWKLPEAAMA